MAEFKPGDVVWFKSGGPEMTVEICGEADKEGMVFCRWYENKQTKSEWLSEVILELVPPPSAPIVVQPMRPRASAAWLGRNR
jgi:uncharacterized protein YodC (DUF2158 family)